MGLKKTLLTEAPGTNSYPPRLAAFPFSESKLSTGGMEAATFSAFSCRNKVHRIRCPFTNLHVPHQTSELSFRTPAKAIFFFPHWSAPSVPSLPLQSSDKLICPLLEYVPGFYIWTLLLEQTSSSLRLILSCAPAAGFYIWRVFNSALPELFCCRPLSYNSLLYLFCPSSI